ncbi:MAG: hypothetical protein GY784_16125 [Gammaproteobacteria bacterium]|nr:hypothetical protein [Gammaproteobacteria bacterium]
MQSLKSCGGCSVAAAGSVSSSSTDGKFPNILSGQLNQHDDDPQTIDLKELIAADGLPVELRGLSSDMVEMPVEQASLTVLKLADGVGEEFVGIASPDAGHVLPVGGNVLPLEPGAFDKSIPAVTNLTAGEIKPIAGPFPAGIKEAINAGAEKAESIKLSDLRAVDSALSSRNGESGLPTKAELQNEMQNSRSGELHGMQSKQIDIAELSNSQHRLQNHTNVLASQTTQPTIQQNTAMLPTSLETLNVANSRDAATWGNGIGERVHWMINQKLNSATIRLDPPMLGRLEVSIQVRDDVTNVTIHTQHAQTRDLIDNASFRLRDYLQENGYQNVNVDVSQQQGQQASAQTSEDSDHHAADTTAKQDVEVEDEGQRVGFMSSDSVVDYFV